MSIVQTAEAKAEQLWTELKAEGHHLADRAKEIWDELRADAPKLESEAEQDASDVVATAETQGIVPAEHEAGADAVQLAQDAVHDVAAAVEGSGKPPAQDAPAA